MPKVFVATEAKDLIPAARANTLRACMEDVRKMKEMGLDAPGIAIAVFGMFMAMRRAVQLVPPGTSQFPYAQGMLLGAGEAVQHIGKAVEEFDGDISGIDLVAVLDKFAADAENGLDMQEMEPEALASLVFAGTGKVASA